MDILSSARATYTRVFRPQVYQAHMVEALRYLVGDVPASSSDMREISVSMDSWDPEKERDPRANKKGIGIYDEMYSDDAVESSATLALSFMMNGFSIEPGEAEDMERSREIARFFRALFRHMEGSEIDVLRGQVLAEICRAGFGIAEDVPEPMVIPEFGPIMGMKKFKVRPSKTFWQGRKGTGGIITDIHGNIEMFQQETGTSYIDIPPDKVFYFARQSSPHNPYGKSLLFAAYIPFVGKQRVLRNLDTFLLTSASGIKELVMDPEAWADERKVTLARERLNKMAPQGVVIYPGPDENGKGGWNFKLSIPPGTAGEHFAKAIMNKNSAIRSAILTVDSLSSPDGSSGGSYASLEAREQMAHDTMADFGLSYMQALQEYIVPKYMRLNGYNPEVDPWPVFKPTRARQEVPVSVVLDTLGKAKQQGIIQYDLEQDAQLELTNKALADVNMKIEAFAEPQPVNIPAFEAPEEQNLTHKHRPRITMAGASRPKGRRVEDVKRQGKEYDKSLSGAAQIMTKAGADTTRRQMEALEKALFKTVNNQPIWKSTKSREIRKALEDNITAGRAEMHKAMISVGKQAWNLGNQQAEEMSGGKKAVVELQARVERELGPIMGRPKAMTRPVAEDWIWNTTYEHLKKTYSSLEHGAWNILNNANRNVYSPAETLIRLQDYFIKNGFENLAATGVIVDTTYATIYNTARTNLWDSLADPTGTIPGGVKGYFIDAVLDEHTTDYCTEINDKFFRIDDPSYTPPPYHHRCRTVSIPVLTGDELWGGGDWTSLEDSAKLKAELPEGFGG